MRPRPQRRTGPAAAMAGRARCSVGLICLAVAAIAIAAPGCAGHGKSSRAPLRVAVAPYYPPIVFEQDGEVMGVEAELATALGARLDRPVEYVRMTRQELIAAVEGGDVDIAMSGISITPKRSRRVLFTEPYLRIGQLALIRSADAAQLSGENDLRKPGVRIGYVAGTTGEAFVTEQLGSSESYAFATVAEGVRNLRARRIDVFVHDAPTVWRIGASIDERALMGVYRPLTDEALAWAVRKNRPELAAEVNEILQSWKDSGQLDRVLNRWIPVRVEVR